MHIVRFLTLKNARYVLNENSTFCLHNVDYYRELENVNKDFVLGDKMENKADFREKNHSYYESGVATLLSCWTILESNCLSVNDWNTFQDNEIAIVSTVDCVTKFLKESTKYLLCDEFWSLKHKAVQYYGDNKPDNFDILDPFWKRNKYVYQREYRFAFLSSSKRAHLRTLVYSVDIPPPYIKSIEV